MVQWSQSVNRNFFSVSTKPKENVQRLEYESGRVQTWLKNPGIKKTHTANLLLWNKTEEAAFWTWYESTLKSGSLSVSLPDMITGTGSKEYIFMEEPSVSEGAYPRTLTLSLEEV